MQRNTTRILSLVLAASTFTGCAGAGNIGNVLGEVLGSPAGTAQGGEASGVVTGVDTRTRQIGLQLSNGQTVGLQYDQNTRVVFENQNYPPTALERGDRINARVQQTNGGYYTDYILVTQSVSGSAGSTGSAQVRQFAGTVQQVDLNNGLFSVSIQGSGTVTVSMPYNASTADRSRFQQLRRGDYVRFYGSVVNNNRIELRQFN